MKRRCVVTGMGAVTPIGNTTEEFWENLKNGVNGIDFITKFDASDFKVKIAGEVKNFDPEMYVPRKEVKRNDMYSLFAIAAAQQAYDMSGLKEDEIDHDRFGAIVGSGIGGLFTMNEQVMKIVNKGPSKVSPLFVPMTISNMAAGNVSIRFKTRGISANVVSACATGTNSIGEAYLKIKDGYQDIMFAGGAEASISPIGVAGFTNLTALSRNPDPKKACRPFDKNRDGFVMGDGAGMLIIEELEHAKKRGAKIYAEIVGYGSTSDAYHITAPCPDGSGAAKAMKMAMESAGITPDEVDYINAHGTSTKANDSGETAAIKLAMGDYAKKVAISSTKSMTGHLLGAAGAIEAIACIEAVQCDFVPPTINYETPDEECDLDYVPNVGRSMKVKYALSNSLGFGGHNAVLCFKKWED
ncbi:MAG: beta-ketoacyl-ACP synthase II [Clostridia bacterium]|jgi:3-oxoacyl-[acyl-carrier-protein] synthase II|nr:beta-ketoacyl-ACP synthase II [Clostridia bacterium]MCI2000025.1 beta-ketoacyl-ACP synthase II [Clostridia bacterium]MCI2014441.1 beta-ketoacyl-ACP synthase II [Clostridia bacterium]